MGGISSDIRSDILFKATRRMDRQLEISIYPHNHSLREVYLSVKQIFDCIPDDLPP